MPEGNEVWVLTGGVASGKSSFLERLKRRRPELGVFLADENARQWLESPSLRKEIEAVFEGEEVFESGVPKRERIRELIFGDPKRRGRLEAILHPRVIEDCKKAIEGYLASQASSPFLADIPLYYEAAIHLPGVKVVVVAASPSTQILRLQGRGIPEDIAGLILDSQFPFTKKVKAAHRVIWNDGTTRQLDRQAELFFRNDPSS
ncbi:MAG: dephospho-CoA kinase [Verrucomicrobiota bacterium]